MERLSSHSRWWIGIAGTLGYALIASGLFTLVALLQHFGLTTNEAIARQLPVSIGFPLIVFVVTLGHVTVLGTYLVAPFFAVCLFFDVRELRRTGTNLPSSSLTYVLLGILPVVSLLIYPFGSALLTVISSIVYLKQRHERVGIP